MAGCRFALLALICTAATSWSCTPRGTGDRAAPVTQPVPAPDPVVRESATPQAADGRRFSAALGLAKGYLTQAVGPDGMFTYEYDPATDLDSGQYNVLRHAGTVYAMMELYEADRDPHLLAAADRAVAYLLEQVKPGRAEGTACVVEDGWVKLGGNALAAVALAEYTRVTGDRRHVPVVLGLARWIVQTQDADGRFVGHKQRYPGGQRADFVSAYYPGEAILALARTHALDPDGPWMAHAHRGADWLIRVRDAGKTADTIAHDHWLLYALGELHRDRPERAYADHALLIAQAIVAANVGVRADEETTAGDDTNATDADAEEAAEADANADADANEDTEADAVSDAGVGADTPDDGVGAGALKARAGVSGATGANQVATRIEGLCAAHPLLARAGEDAAAAEVHGAVARAAKALAEFQFTAADAARFPRPARVAGGFRAGSTSDVIRIDTVQHSVSALLAARGIGAE